MYFSIRQTNNKKLIENLHQQCFPGEDFYEHDKNKYWVAMDRDGVALGFGIATDFGNGVYFLSRSGVLAKYRGKRIHERIIKVRIRDARRRKFKSVITYTAKENHASVNNLIRCGFLSYTPADKYVGDDFNYWILEDF